MSWGLNKYELAKGIVEAGVRKSMCKGSAVNAPAEEQIVWCGRNTGNMWWGRSK